MPPVFHHEGHLRDCATFQEEGGLPLEGSSCILPLGLGMLLSFNRYDIFLREGAFLPLGECKVRNLRGKISWADRAEGLDFPQSTHQRNASFLAELLKVKTQRNRLH